MAEARGRRGGRGGQRERWCSIDHFASSVLALQLKNHLQLSARYSGSDFMSREQLSTAAKLAGMEHVLTDERLDGFFSPRLSPRGSIKNGKTDWRYVNKVRIRHVEK